MRATATYEFAEPLGYRPLEVDIWMPAGVPTPPVVVWVHGGGWLSGTRRHTPETYPDMFQQLCDAGFAVASLDYRLSAEVRFPDMIADVTAGFAWLVERADVLGVDGSRIAVWGESAGAHLATLLAFQTRPADRIRCVVPFYGPSDFLTIDAHTRAMPEPMVDRLAVDNAVSLMLGATITERPDLAQAASPLTYAHVDAPPMLVLHGEDDRTVPIAQSEQMAEHLAAIGADVTFEPVPGADHIFAGHPDPSRIIERAIAFTAKHTSERR
jgi:acetyl esterase/lipase